MGSRSRQSPPAFHDDSHPHYHSHSHRFDMDPSLIELLMMREMMNDPSFDLDILLSTDSDDSDQEWAQNSHSGWKGKRSEVEVEREREEEAGKQRERKLERDIKESLGRFQELDGNYRGKVDIKGGIYGTPSTYRGDHENYCKREMNGNDSKNSNLNQTHTRGEPSPPNPEQQSSSSSSKPKNGNTSNYRADSSFGNRRNGSDDSKADDSGTQQSPWLEKIKNFYESPEGGTSNDNQSGSEQIIFEDSKETQEEDEVDIEGAPKLSRTQRRSLARKKAKESKASSKPFDSNFDH